jgi:hypothetical protein
LVDSDAEEVAGALTAFSFLKVETKDHCSLRDFIDHDETVAETASQPLHHEQEATESLENLAREIRQRHRWSEELHIPLLRPEGQIWRVRVSVGYISKSPIESN